MPETRGKYTVKGSIYWRSLSPLDSGQKNQTSPLNDTPHSLSPVPWNILHVTQGVLCSSCNRKFICCEKKYSFIYRKNVFYDIRCSFLFLSQEVNFLSQEIFFLWQEQSFCLTDIILLSEKIFLLTLVYFIMWQKLFLLLQGVLCVSHEEYFLSQKGFFILLCHKKYFSCGTK